MLRSEIIYGEFMQKIIYEDDKLIAIHKRAGFATQTAKLGEKDVVTDTLSYVKKKYKSTAPHVGLINRLDQPVEGIVLLGLDKNATASLTSQLQSGGINKHYFAAVCGVPKVQQGLIADYMVKDTANNISRICECDEEGAQKALLEYKCIKTVNDEISLLDIHLITGRHHQIRLQLSAAGMPLLGDKKYASEEAFKVSDRLNIRNVALCAYSLSFEHPVTGERLELSVTPQGEWYKLF